MGNLFFRLIVSLKSVISLPSLSRCPRSQWLRRHRVKAETLIGKVLNQVCYNLLTVHSYDTVPVRKAAYAVLVRTDLREKYRTWTVELNIISRGDWMSNWFRLCGVQDSTESSWALSWQHWVKLRVIWSRTESSWALFEAELSKTERWRDSKESSWELSRRALSQADNYLGQHRVKLSAVRGTVESSWALSRTALSKAESYLGQHRVSWELSGTAQSQAEHCPRQSWVKLSAVWGSTQSNCPGQSWAPETASSQFYFIVWLFLISKTIVALVESLLSIITVLN